MDIDSRRVWGIVLAGGDGKRLRSFIRSEYGTATPKQFCAFTGTRSMLRHTIDRAEMLIDPERLLTIVSSHHTVYAQDQLGDRPPGTVLYQPANRETGPGILYPLLHVYRRDPEAIVCLFPADHFVLNERTFMDHIDFSAEHIVGNPGSILLLGVRPHAAEGEYGWIVPGEPIVNDERRVYPVSRFVEKPDLSTAHKLYSKGSLWNTMVIVSKARTLLTSFKALTPSLYRTFWRIRDVLGSTRETPIVKQVYSGLSSMNFSRSILGRKRLGLCTLTVDGVYWSDWGSAARIIADTRRFRFPMEKSPWKTFTA